jgi:5-(carboxyamino)imidazole ribonucleotide synthase
MSSFYPPSRRGLTSTMTSMIAAATVQPMADLIPTPAPVPSPFRLHDGALPFGSTIGVIGGGQLEKMTIQAAQNLGYRAVSYGKEADGCANLVTPHSIVAEYDDKMALARFASICDVVTVCWENVPITMLETLAELKPSLQIHPSPQVLATAQDRHREKTHASSTGFSTCQFWRIETESDVEKLAQVLNGTHIVKTNRLGYDGQRQIRIDDGSQLLDAWNTLERVECIVEELVRFDSEISVIIARDMAGRKECFEPFRNTHSKGILHKTEWPARISASVAKKAIKHAQVMADSLRIVGVLGIEMFVCGEDVLFNEMAARPHNSGHLTRECAQTSQFEQLVRAIAGLPLGEPRRLAHKATMMNVIGTQNGFLDGIDKDASITVYGKAERPGIARKLGHYVVIES